jgi:hypothetical protein
MDMETFNQSAASTPMSRVVRGGFPDRQFDVDFWQQQGDEAIFAAAWEMVEFAAEFKGSNVELKPDFKDLLRLLNQHQVQCLIVGGYAVMKYTEPFYTKDLDIWIEPTPENARRANAVLMEFGAPARVDIMTTIDAVTFSEAWPNRVETHLSGIPISIISLPDLIRNKEAASRDSDQLHLTRLREYGRR